MLLWSLVKSSENNQKKEDICINPLAIFYGCTAGFVSDLVGNPEDKFSNDVAQINNKTSVQLTSSLYKENYSRQ